MAVRAALGASRGRLLRQGLAEGLVIAAIGGVAGVGVGMAGVETLLRLAPGEVARIDEVGLDATVIGWAALVIGITGVLFGLASAGIGAMPRAGAAVSLATRGSSATRTSRRVRQVMIGVQSALAMLLLVGSVLLVSGLYRLTRTPLGFDPHGVIALTFPTLPTELRAPARLVGVERALRESLATVPGVTAAATTSIAPLGERGWNMPMTIDGRPDLTEGAVEWRAVSPEYAAVMGLGPVQGRWLNEADVDTGPPVMVVSSSFASRYFPDGDVLGQRVWLGVFRGERRPNAAGAPHEIVGVVADLRDLGPTRPPRRMVFVPPGSAQADQAGLPPFVLRAAAAVSLESLRAAVRAADPALPEPIISTMASRLGARLARDRFSSLLMTVFAAVALLLTTVGVYGVVSWIVRHATHEIGIRIALGAGRSRVVGDALRHGLVPVLIGLGAGGAVALAASGVFAGLVVGATTVSAQVAMLAAAVLVAAAAIAAWIPARRALRVDPVSALRAD
jgi:putative ABC transport system permease protein